KQRLRLYGGFKGACPWGRHALISPSRRSAPDGSPPDASGPRWNGQVAEWLKAHAWNACIGATLSRVRLPLCPPHIIIISFIFNHLCLHLAILLSGLAKFC